MSLFNPASAQTFKDPLFLGIDGGGTKCKVHLEDANGNLLGQGIGGPANIVRSIDDTINAILSATTAALEHAQLPLDAMANIHAGAGLAGANVLKAREAFAQWQHPFANLFVTTDMEIACLGAHLSDDGSVIILGTGFCGGTKIGGIVQDVGGYGLFLGDQASGASMGLKAVQHCFKVLDGIIPSCPLTNQILEKLACFTSEQLLSFGLSATPNAYAALAPTVFKHADQGNNVAVQILNEASHFVSLYADMLLAKTPARLTLVGGIAQPLMPWLPANLQAQIKPPLSTPEQGATLFARQQLLAHRTLVAS